MQRNESEAEIGVCIRVLPLEPPADRVHLRLRLLERYARLQTRHSGVIVITAIESGGIEDERQPGFGAAGNLAVAARHIRQWKLKLRRHDTDHRAADAIEGERLADDLRIRAETPMPQAITQDDDGGGARLVFIGEKDAPQLRLRAEQLKNIGRDSQPGNSLRLISACEIEP